MENSVFMISMQKKIKIGDVCKIVKGTTGIASAQPGKYPLVVTAVERKTCSTFQFDCEAVCIPLVSSSGHGKKSLNNVHYQSGKFALGTILCAVIPNNSDELDARYLHQYLQFYKDTVLVPLMKGAANVSLSMKDIAGVSIPLPSIKRQRELAEMFVSLQEKQKELFAEFEKQTEYAKQLRKNILQEAIEGKLTADWRKQHPVQKGNPDYDAEALFDKIQAEKSETKNSKRTVAPIAKDEIPFEIPTNWKWLRLGDIGSWSAGATPIKTERNYYINGTIPWVRTGDLNDSCISEIPEKITELALQECSLRLNPVGSVLIAMYGATIGRVGLLTIPATTNQACCACIPFQKGFNQYLFYLLISLRNQFKEKSWGAAQPNISKEIIVNTVFPLPPLAEQKEIVARVEKHLKTITQLETQIATRETTTKQLMQSILKDAFEER